jgi:iron complex transport system ATP-binding protein
MNVLDLKHVSTAPWGTTLLEDISLELGAGEILGIIGPNGAGKTSLLQTLSGDHASTQGSVRFLGRDIANWQGLDRAKSLAVLPQLSLLNFPYTVEEVIMLGRTPHSSGAQADRVILTEVMRSTDTERLQNRIYTQLSGGEKQRVHLARVFAQIWPDIQHEPRLLLLDEPTAALDLAHQKLMMNTLRELANKGCAIVIVAHDFNLVAAVADKISVLKEGRQIAYGSADEVLTKDIFARVFAVDVTISTHPDTGRPLVISL